MKKFLSLMVASMISTSASATIALADATDKFYLRADAGAAQDMNRKVATNRGSDITLKSKRSASADIGIGYNISQEFRIELIYLHRFNPKMDGGGAVNGNSDVSRHIKSKAKIETLMLRNYFDFYDFGVGKLFAGAGIGISQVSRKGSITVARSGITIRQNNISNKKKNNLAYSLAAGISFKANEKINLDLQYNWSDFGSAKGSSVKYRGHSVMAGVRVDLY